MKILWNFNNFPKIVKNIRDFIHFNAFGVRGLRKMAKYFSRKYGFLILGSTPVIFGSAGGHIGTLVPLGQRSKHDHLAAGALLDCQDRSDVARCSCLKLLGTRAALKRRRGLWRRAAPRSQFAPAGTAEDSPGRGTPENSFSKVLSKSVPDSEGFRRKLFQCI